MCSYSHKGPSISLLPWNLILNPILSPWEVPSGVQRQGKCRMAVQNCARWQCLAVYVSGRSSVWAFVNKAFSLYPGTCGMRAGPCCPCFWIKAASAGSTNNLHDVIHMKLGLQNIVFATVFVLWLQGCLVHQSYCSVLNSSICAFTSMLDIYSLLFNCISIDAQWWSFQYVYLAENIYSHKIKFCC